MTELSPGRRGPHLVGRAGFPFLLVGLALSLIASIAVAIAIGTVDVPLRDVADVIWSNITGSTAELDPLLDQIVWTFRTPRVLVAAVVGAGLAVAGVCLQALVRNPLADPYLLGVSSGAALGAVLALTLGSGALALLGVTGAAFIGAMISLVLVFVLAQRSGQLSATRLVLAGVALAYLGNAATSFVQLEANPTELRGVMFWLLGSVAGASWDDLTIPTLTMVVTSAWLIGQARNMNALTLGDDTAAGLGIDVHRLRRELLVVSSVLTATAVSVAGGIGFVGLMVPHAVRLIVGPDHRRVLPVAILGGAVFMVIVDLVSRTVNRPNEMPIGILTAAIGAPFFLWLLRRQGRAATA